MGARNSEARRGGTRTSSRERLPFAFSMKTLFVLSIGGAALLHCQAGTIVGTVRAQGKEGASEDLVAGKYDSRKFKFIERVNYAEMRDFIVYIDEPATQPPAPPAEPVQVVTTKKITQRGAVFSPHV